MRPPLAFVKAFTLLLLGVVTSLAVLGCAKREDPLLVDGRSASTLRAWRSASSPRLAVAKWREFDAAMDEIRFELQRDDPTLAHAEAVEAAARRVHGMTVDEALREGDIARLRRLEPMAAQLSDMVNGNALIVTNPGDQESAGALRAKLKDQQARLAKLQDEIAALRARHANEPVAPRAPSASPKSFPREEALREIEQFIAARRSTAMVKYGAWQVRLTGEAGDLPAELQEDFRSRQARAIRNGGTLLAVKIRDSWRIFDQVVPPPGFSAAVTANLTDADQAAIQEKWARLEVEIWARQQSAEDNRAGEMS